MAFLGQVRKKNALESVHFLHLSAVFSASILNRKLSKFC